MIEITEGFVDALAPNASAIKNAQGLVKKRSFVQLYHSSDGTLLFGECSGSGKSNYACSADFMDAEKPILRCSCPSRQFPCKHSLGLLYAYVGGQTFAQADIPEDILVKREKAEQREQKKQQAADDEGSKQKPKKVNKSALKKKIQAQLEGLDVLEKLTLSLIRSGLGTIDKSVLKTMKEHVKQLGNYYLSGAQIELRRLILLLEHEERESVYTQAVEQLTQIHAFIKKGRAHLLAKLEDPALALDHESSIEEWLGHAWQLAELKEAGLVSEQAELIQLAFLSYDDQARQEYVDLGFWFDKASGEVHRTLQYRPYKAAKFIKEDDSFFEVAQMSELYRYPGDMNRRVRWEAMTSRPIEEQDLDVVHKNARHSYTDAVKLVKNQLKNALGDRHPVLLVHAHQVRQNEEGQFVSLDETGQQLMLYDTDGFNRGTVSLLPYMPEHMLNDVTMLVMFEHQQDSGRLTAQPLTIIKGTEMIRLLY
ncbi:SWIM zinc finger family protein [Paenibacillus sp. 1001270B_150601_E10]|uniref:SWIM zinc finger family protein n=1 Tax=Paenibacillus sp. 1001270B_150601_E10 TaxID=2787079 RepID=UPI00189C625F|nr:SWIM zinc finger family protein [Paenibacillus sp. 1001270B_150601_E10]